METILTHITRWSHGGKKIPYFDTFVKLSEKEITEKLRRLPEPVVLAGHSVATFVKHARNWLVGTHVEPTQLYIPPNQDTCYWQKINGSYSSLHALATNANNFLPSTLPIPVTPVIEASTLFGAHVHSIENYAYTTLSKMPMRLHCKEKRLGPSLESTGRTQEVVIRETRNDPTVPLAH